MSSSVFVIDSDNALRELRRTDYDSEDLFQRLLADHPSLLGHGLGGDGQLLLVRREAPVPQAADGAGRWSLDHLFLDREGVPVLVEVKRASDTRARREVVAQMLDYAANGVAYWPLERIVSDFEASATAAGESPEARLSGFLEGGDPEAFWRQVESNLRSGRVRMVFVADRIAKELRRIVEFLNEQMRPAEVLAVEVEQYATETGLRMLTPRLIGATERASVSKSVQSTRPRVTDEEWIESLATARGRSAADAARLAAEWFRAQGHRAEVTSSQDSIVVTFLRADGKPSYPFNIRRSNGRLETSLESLSRNPAFADEGARQAILDQLKEIPGAELATTGMLTGLPGIPLERLHQPEVWAGFMAVAEEIFVRNALAGGSAAD